MNSTHNAATNKHSHTHVTEHTVPIVRDIACTFVEGVGHCTHAYLAMPPPTTAHPFLVVVIEFIVVVVHDNI
jgi:hypothetical protein